MALNFDWDRNKANSNHQKHGVSFSEAATVFSDPFAITIYDAIHSIEEERYITLGLSDRQRLIVVVHTEQDYNTRIISARVPTKSERKTYGENANRF
jgi:uncharacterized DUF497 family protein